MIAYAQDRSSRSTGVTNLALAFTGATGAGSLIVVGVIPESLTASVTSVTDTQGNTYRFVRRQTFTGSYSMEVWYAYNTAGGACTVTVNLSLAANVDCSIAEYTGAATHSDPLDTSNGATDAGASASLGLNTSVPNTLLYGLIGSTYSSPSAGAGCTLRSNFDTGRQIYWAPEDSSGTANTAGVNAIAFVNSTAQNGFIGVAFKPPVRALAPVGRMTHLLKKIELDIYTSGVMTFQLATDQPGDSMALRDTQDFNTAATTTGRRTVLIVLPGTTRASRAQGTVYGPNVCKLYGARVYARPMTGPGDWGWYALPVRLTDEVYAGAALPIRATSDAFGAAGLPIRRTEDLFGVAHLPIRPTPGPDAWATGPLPIPQTPLVPQWIALAMDAVE